MTQSWRILPVVDSAHAVAEHARAVYRTLVYFAYAYESIILHSEYCRRSQQYFLNPLELPASCTTLSHVLFHAFFSDEHVVKFVHLLTFPPFVLLFSPSRMALGQRWTRWTSKEKRASLSNLRLHFVHGITITSTSLTHQDTLISRSRYGIRSSRSKVGGK